MTAEFNVWLLIVGLVVGAGLVWLVIMDSRRRESEVGEVERPREAAWLSAVMAEDGYDVSPEAAEQLLLLHQAYLEAAPPDGAPDHGEPWDPVDAAASAAPTTTATGAPAATADWAPGVTPKPPDEAPRSGPEPRSG